ncbi:MAG: hypothetical protein QM756_34685 [Polyangiaceae bacterium]
MQNWLFGRGYLGLSRWRRVQLVGAACWLFVGGCGDSSGDDDGGSGGASGGRGSGGAQQSGGGSASGGRIAAGGAGAGVGGSGGRNASGGSNSGGSNSGGSIATDAGASGSAGAPVIGDGGSAGAETTGGSGSGGTTVVGGEGGAGGSSGSSGDGGGGDGGGGDGGGGDGGSGPLLNLCGNGVQDVGEACDRGSLNGTYYGDGSGCTRACTAESSCRDASGNQACVGTCGDGNVDAGELCDDGNRLSGDGCSKSCALEGGFICTDTKESLSVPCASNANGRCLTFPIVYRDFDGQNLSTGHPDFSSWAPRSAPTKTSCVPNASGANRLSLPANGTCPTTDATDRCTGIVQASLGADGKPQLGSTTSCQCTYTDWYATGVLAGAAGVAICNSGASAPQYVKDATVKVVQSADSFRQWYNDSALSTKVTGGLELERVAGTEQFRFSSSNGKTVYDDLHELWLASKSIPTPSGASTSLSSGFFPLEASPRPKVCNLYPYWIAGLNASNCVAADGNPLTYQWDARGWNSGQASGPLSGETLGVVVKPVTGAMRNFYFTSELRYVFRYFGGESLTFAGSDDTWIFINGHLVVNLGAPHERMRAQNHSGREQRHLLGVRSQQHD